MLVLQFVECDAQQTNAQQITQGTAEDEQTVLSQREAYSIICEYLQYGRTSLFATKSWPPIVLSEGRSENVSICKLSIKQSWR